MNSNQVVILIFGILYFGYILYTRRKTDFAEYSVAGRTMGTFLIFASICASYIGPGSTMGVSRDGYGNGFFLLGILVTVGLVMILVGLFLAGKIRERFSDSYSVGDVVGGAGSHRHQAVKFSMGVVAWMLMSALTIIMSYAGGELLNNVFGFSKFWSIFIMTAIVVIYSTFGGIRATIQTDAFQFIVFVLLLPALGLLLFFNADFSWEPYVTQASASAVTFRDSQSAGVILGIGLALAFSNTGLDAPIVSRFLASRDSKVARNAMILSGVFTIFWGLLLLFIGSAGAYLHPELGDSDQVLLQIAEMHFPDALYGVFIVAMLGVVMSTQDTTLNGASIVFSQDILSTLKPGITDAQKLFYAKIYTIFLGIAAVIIAVYITSVLGAIINVVTFYIPVMLPVTFFSIVKKKHYWQSAVISMICGFFFCLFWQKAGSESLPPLFIGLSAGILAYLITDQFLDLRNKSERQRLR